MNNNLLSKLFFFCSCLFLFSSCGEKNKLVEEDVFYVCSMDPQVMEKQAGMCPICKMPLSKVILTKEDLQSTSIKLNETQIRLANIKTDTIRKQTIFEEKTFTGTIVMDENKIQQISTRVSGRVDHLYVKNIGERVELGQVLYDLYSEDLISSQKEFLLSIKNKKLFSNNSIVYENIINSAKNKLLLWGMNEKQIEQLKLEGIVHESVPIISSASGIITNIQIKEGDYVEEGLNIFEVADLSFLWIEGQIYSNDLPNVKAQSEVEFIIPSISDEKIIGKVSFVNPEIMQDNKINLIRIEIDNSKMIYHPGMMAYIIIKENKKNALAVPSKSVLQGEIGNIVWIQNHDGKFEHRIVSIGIQNKELIEITSGLNEGQNIVISGAYMLNSEFVFKKGYDPMTHMHGDMK